MSSATSSRLKKYEPLDRRDFIPFEDYEELSVEDIKEACESFTKLRLDRAIFSLRIEALRAQKSSRLKVAKYLISSTLPYWIPNAQPRDRARSAPVSSSCTKRASTNMSTTCMKMMGSKFVYYTFVYYWVAAIENCHGARIIVIEPKNMTTSRVV